ncbi:hypothetical protein MRB53_016739 [Persea americana]|uniref:Uncharacterized protein n=1 Tax=Persea americana TaxID=3435 RepID=A0ACC2M314_PERAE|nr:hypothetical protein MRB53_016739 [Persea americana]
MDRRGFADLLTTHFSQAVTTRVCEVKLFTGCEASGRVQFQVAFELHPGVELLGCRIFSNELRFASLSGGCQCIRWLFVCV